MVCHICGQSAIGQCQACWKFYCQSHGDLICRTCRQQRDTDQPGDRSVVMVVGHDDPGHTEHHVRSHSPPDLGAEVLRRVIGVAQTAKVGDTELGLVSLELYPGGFIVNFRLREMAGDTSPATLSFPKHPDFSPQATDDLGNVYEGYPRGAGGSPGHWRATYHFSPAPLAAAKAIQFTIAEVRWMAHGPGQQSSAESGPWAFHVTL